MNPLGGNLANECKNCGLNSDIFTIKDSNSLKIQSGYATTITIVSQDGKDNMTAVFKSGIPSPSITNPKKSEDKWYIDLYGTRMHVVSSNGVLTLTLEDIHDKKMTYISQPPHTLPPTPHTLPPTPVNEHFEVMGHNIPNIDLIILIILIGLLVFVIYKNKGKLF